MESISQEWQLRRNEFNHDWLKNQYLPILAKFNNLLKNELEDKKLEKVFIDTVVPQWSGIKQQAILLVEDFESHMSPKALLEEGLLSSLPNDFRIWISNLIHVLWKRRYPVHYWICNTLKCIHDLDENKDKLIKALENCPDTKSALTLRPFFSLFENFYISCHNLAQAIEQFPNKVRVV